MFVGWRFSDVKANVTSQLITGLSNFSVLYLRV